MENKANTETNPFHLFTTTEIQASIETMHGRLDDLDKEISTLETSLFVVQDKPTSLRHPPTIALLDAKHGAAMTSQARILDRLRDARDVFEERIEGYCTFGC